MAAWSTSTVANLGSDLSNDHPIGIQYCGGGMTGTGTTVSGTCRDSDFQVAPRVATQSLNGNQGFWVETGPVNGLKQRTDLPLYTRTFSAANGGAGPSVECGTCHDPHVSEGQAGPNSQVSGATFLRVSNAGSAVCTGLPREVGDTPARTQGARAGGSPALSWPGSSWQHPTHTTTTELAPQRLQRSPACAHPDPPARRGCSRRPPLSRLRR